MSDKFTNREEQHYFLHGALAWHGSVTPRILLSVLVMGLYTYGLFYLDMNYYKLPRFAVTPFEYTGVVLGLVLVFRTNAGYDRWWEARKLWGAITNQIRNLLVMTWNYGESNQAWREEMMKWLVTFAFAHKESLRLQKDFDALEDWLSADEIVALQNAPHSPLFVSDKIAALLQQARSRQQFDPLILLQFEKQRAALIDSIGGNERILKTPMPLVYVIKTRRFLLTYLVLLPFSLIDEAQMMSPFIAALVAYPLLSLDRIGVELQNPFARKNLSHLPLDLICDGIKANALALRK
jgi:putative membrane protein